MSKNILLISDNILKERTAIHGNIDPKLIYPDIKYVQDAFIKPVLGSALFDKIQTLIGDNTINDPGNADYKLLLDEYIIDTLIYYTLAELPVNLSYQFWNKGVVRKQGQDTDLPTMADLVDISNRHKSKAEYYANRMKLFIIDQNGRFQKYLEYTHPGSTIDTITPEQRNFTSPIYLGDTDGRDNPFCNKGGFNGQPYHD
jgi:hypothetical protein